MSAFFWPAAIYLFILVVHVAIPGRWVDGYVVDAGTGRKLRYRLNGLPVLGVTVSCWVLACLCGLLSWDAFHVHRWEMLAGACVLGLIYTLAIVLPAKPVAGNGIWADLYLGRLENPQWGGGRIDAKMFLYLAGAVMLELNVLSFTARHLALHGDDPSLGVLAVRGALHLLRHRVPLLRGGSPLHVRLHGRARRLQARLGLLRLLPVLLLRGPVGPGRGAQSAHLAAAVGVVRCCCSFRAGCSRAAPTFRNSTSSATRTPRLLASSIRDR